MSKNCPEGLKTQFLDIFAYLVNAFVWSPCPMLARYKVRGPLEGGLGGGFLAKFFMFMPFRDLHDDLRWQTPESFHWIAGWAVCHYKPPHCSLFSSSGAGCARSIASDAEGALLQGHLPRRPRDKESPQYCRKVYWTKMVQNGPNDHFGQNDLIPNWILVFARPKWTKMVHFGPFWPKRSILVHLGPPTVLWPLLKGSATFPTNKKKSPTSFCRSAGRRSRLEQRQVVVNSAIRIATVRFLSLLLRKEGKPRKMKV